MSEKHDDKSIAGCSITGLTGCPVCKFGTLDRLNQHMLKCADCGQEYQSEEFQKDNISVKQLKSNNGDTLEKLEEQEYDAAIACRKYKTESEPLETELKLLRELISESESRLENIRCRKKVWMLEHGRKL